MTGLFGAIARPRADITESLPMEKFLRLLGGGTKTNAGEFVSTSSAMRYSTVMICLRVLSESVASLPCILYKKRKDGGKDRATEHPLYRVLHDQPNDWQTAFTYYAGTMVNLATRGNGYAFREQNSKGQTIGIVPLNPDPVTIEQASDWSPIYTVTLPDNTRAKLKPSQIHHIVGPLPKGYLGQSMISLAREPIGLGIAAEHFGANLFGNGARPSGVLTHPKSIGPAAVETLRDQFAEKYSGIENSAKPLLLEEGMEWVALSIKPDEAQFLETRKFQRSEIAGIFRVPAHLVGDLEKATFSNIEHQTLDFVVHSLRPWLKLWEQSINKDLLTEQERADGYFCEFLIDDLLRGDFATRMAGYALGIQNGIWNPDEVRIKENANRRDDGKGGEFWKPTNMYPPQPKAAPASTDDPAQAGAQASLVEFILGRHMDSLKPPTQPGA